MSLTRPEHVVPFVLGTTVWRVQRAPGETGEWDSWKVLGPAKVTAVIERESHTTYLLTWLTGPEVTDEQSGDPLFVTEMAAQNEADARHNAGLLARMRPPMHLDQAADEALDPEGPR